MGSGRGLYRRWGIAPRPETNFLAHSIAQRPGFVNPMGQKFVLFFTSPALSPEDLRLLPEYAILNLF
mgnify:FL=1